MEFPSPLTASTSSTRKPINSRSARAAANVDMRVAGRAFREAGVVVSAKYLAAGVHFASGNSRAFDSKAKKWGREYEAKAQAALARDFGDAYRANPWIEFRDARGARRICQPDGVLRINGRVFLIEIKVRHCVDAWQQLRLLYEPVLRKIHPRDSIACVELTRRYDPAVVFPEPARVIERISDACAGAFSVCEWR